MRLARRTYLTITLAFMSRFPFADSLRSDGQPQHNTLDCLLPAAQLSTALAPMPIRGGHDHMQLAALRSRDKPRARKIMLTRR